MTDNTHDEITTGRVEPSNVLRAALAEDLDEVLVLGWTKGGELYAASSTGDRVEVEALLKIFKRKSSMTVELIPVALLLFVGGFTVGRIYSLWVDNT